MPIRLMAIGPVQRMRLCEELLLDVGGFNLSPEGRLMSPGDAVPRELLSAVSSKVPIKSSFSRILHSQSYLILL